MFLIERCGRRLNMPDRIEQTHDGIERAGGNVKIASEGTSSGLDAFTRLDTRDRRVSLISIANYNPRGVFRRAFRAANRLAEIARYEGLQGIEQRKPRLPASQIANSRSSRVSISTERSRGMSCPRRLGP
jgi:hypothetical protein